MTQEDKFKAVIQRAIDNGWNMFEFRERENGESEVVWQYQHPTLIIQNADQDGNCEVIDNYRLQEIIFDKSFARAFWGEEICKVKFHRFYSANHGEGRLFIDAHLEQSRWRTGLQQLVLQEEPIDYLYSFIKETK